MRRCDSGKLRNLPKLCHESRLLQCWVSRWLAQTAPTASQPVHSCLPFLMYPPSKTLLSELATAGQRHQLHRWSSPLQTDAHCHAPEGDPSWSFSYVAPTHPCSMGFRGNPAHATQVFPDADVDHVQSDDCLGNAATLLDAHVWAQRHFSGTPDSKNGWAYCQRLMVLSWRTCQAQLPRTPSSCGKFSWYRTFQHPLLVSVSFPLVCDVSNVCGLRNRNHFCLSNNTFTSVNIKAYIVHQTRKLLNEIQARNTNFNQGRQQLCFLLLASRAT